MKKKFIVPVLALALGTSSLAGCVKKSNPQPTPSGKSLSSIAITAQPTVTTYEFDVVSVSLEGMEVTAYFSDQTSQVLQSSEYTTTSLEPTAIQKASGSFTVTVSYTYNSVKKSAPVNFTINPAPQADWKEDELALMKAHLLDQSVPYIDLGDSYEVEWDDPYIYVEGGSVDQAALSAYARKFNNSGWQCGEQTYSEGIKYYQFSKTVERQDDAPAIVEGVFYATDSTYSPLASGTFFLRVTLNESYVKDWPTAQVAGLVTAQASASTTVIPAFAASYYKVEAAVPGSTYGSITGYGVDSDPSSSYEALLTGWTLDSEQAYPYALSPDELFGIYYVYSAASKQFVIVVLDAIKKSAEWPATSIAQLISSYSEETVPSFGESSALADIKSFTVVPQYGQIQIEVASGKESSVLAAYQAIIGATWGVNPIYTSGAYISPQLKVEANVFKPSTAGYVVIQLGPHQPNDYLVFNGFASEDRLPSAFAYSAYKDGGIYASYDEFDYIVDPEYISVSAWSSEYNNRYYYYYYDSTTEKYVALRGDDDLDSAEKFAAALAEYGAIYEISYAPTAAKAEALLNAALAAGFFPYYTDSSSVQHYASPNEEFEIAIKVNGKYVEVAAEAIEPADKVYSHSATFPSEQVSFGDGYTAIPAISGASDYLYSLGTTTNVVLAKFADAAAAEEALGTYKASMSGYTETPADSGTFVSAAGDVTISVTSFGVYVALSIADTAVFPLAAMSEWLGESYTEEQVPVVAKAAGLKFKGETSGSGLNKIYTATVTFDSADAAATAKAAYEEALLDSSRSFSYNEQQDTYYSTSLALLVQVSVSENNLVIRFRSYYVNVFSNSSLNTYLGQYGGYTATQLYFPAYYVKSYTTFGFGNFGTFYGLYIVCPSASGASNLSATLWNNIYQTGAWGQTGEGYVIYSYVAPWISTDTIYGNMGTSQSPMYAAIVQIFVDTAAYNNWASLSAIFGGDYTDVIPTINSNNFTLDTSAEDKIVVTFAAESSDAADEAIADYVEALQSSYYGYDYDTATGVYYDSSISVKVEKVTEGEPGSETYSVKITITQTSESLKRDILIGFIEGLLGEPYTDSIPSIAPFDDASLANMSSGLTSGSATFVFEDTASAQAAADAYIASLTGDPNDGGYGFTLVPASGDDPAYYQNEDDTIHAIISVDEDNHAVTLVIEYFAPATFDDAIATLNSYFGVEDYKTYLASFAPYAESFDDVLCGEGEYYIIFTADSDEVGKQMLADYAAALVLMDIEAYDVSENGTQYTAEFYVGTDFYAIIFGYEAGVVTFYIQPGIE